jgi:8-oxo-dGTP pyrophosphatase MutT (NUDIX family)
LSGHALKVVMKPFDVFQQFVTELSARFSEPLPGFDAHLRLAPEFRRTLPQFPENVVGSREAAILALFFPSAVADEPAEILLTVRPEGMSNHAGQVAFPGGRRELNESFLETALRETEEEVFIQPDSIKIAGPLTPLYIPPSKFFVHPFVGYTEHPPDLTVTSDEVARMFSVRVSHLIDPSVRRTATRRLNSAMQQIPYLALNGEFVWGATAMMLAELIDAISTLPVLSLHGHTPS